MGKLLIGICFLDAPRFSRRFLCAQSDARNHAAADDVTDDEIRDAIKLLAETEGIFAETAGGVTVGVAKKLIASGKIPKDSSAVICVTGNGLKTLDAVNGYCGKPREIKPSLREFEALLAHEEKVNA